MIGKDTDSEMARYKYGCQIFFFEQDFSFCSPKFFLSRFWGS